MSSYKTVITNDSSFRIKELIEIWHYRNLLKYFVIRDLKVRYRQTLLGVGWAIFQPLIQLLIFAGIFGKVIKFDSNGLPYPIFVFTALLPWNFFANGISAINYGLLNHAGLIRKVYFPRLIIPLSCLGIVLVDFIITLLIIVIFLLVWGFTPEFSWLYLFPILIILFMLTIGIGALLGAVGAKYRDIRHVIPFLVQIWFFLTPIVYSESVLEKKYRFILYLNPVSGIITNIRNCLIGFPLRIDLLFISLLWAFLCLSIGIWYYQREAKIFADYI